MTKISQSFFILCTSISILLSAHCSSHKAVVAQVDASNVYIKNEKETVDYTAKIKSGMCDNERDRFFKMTDANLIQRAIDHDVGNCTYEEPKKCRDCQCLAYIKISKAEWSGQGWPIDPEKNNGDGCVSALCANNGYKSSMCATKDLKKNGAEQLRDALRNPADVCGLCDRKQKITIQMGLDND